MAFHQLIKKQFVPASIDEVWEFENGVMMTDIVSYKPPLGFLGSIANALLIRRQLEGIFAYREKALKKRFP
jgi:ligand-binding SRPBCC domain-containing protein